MLSPCYYCSEPTQAVKLMEAHLHRAHRIHQKQTDRWYRHQADWLFSERLELCYQLFDGIEPVKPFPELRLRKMRSRWGSCSSRGVITLNTMLVQMPVECIDFVVTHELCHLWELNHSPRFYQLLNSVMPQWRLYEQRVEEWG